MDASKNIFAVVKVFGREDYTYATIKSLAMTELPEDTSIYYKLLFTESEYLDIHEFEVMVKTSGMENYDIEEVDLDCPTKNIYEALRRYKECDGGELVGSWFCYIENDNLFNPNWLIKSFDLMEEAGWDGHEVGLCTPHHTIGKMRENQETDVHFPIDLGRQMNYYIKKRVPGCVMLMPHYCVSRIGLDDRCFKIGKLVDWNLCDRIYSMGFVVISPKVSHAQHIGKVGIKKRDVSTWICGGRGGVGFVPDKKVEELWNMFNDDIVQEN